MINQAQTRIGRNIEQYAVAPIGLVSGVLSVVHNVNSVFGSARGMTVKNMPYKVYSMHIVRFVMEITLDRIGFCLCVALVRQPRLYGTLYTFPQECVLFVLPIFRS